MTRPAKTKAIMPAEEAKDTTHEVISSYFIGPRAENLPQFRENITTILDELQLARKNYFEQDVVSLSFLPGVFQSSPGLC